MARKEANKRQVRDQEQELQEQCVFFVKGKVLSVNMFNSPREANMLRPNQNGLKNQTLTSIYG